MDSEGQGCKICHSTRRQLICPSCIQKTVLSEATLQRLKAARERRAQLESQLNKALKAQEVTHRQQEQLKDRQAATVRAKARFLRAKAKARQGQDEVQLLRELHVRQKSDIEAAAEKLGKDGRNPQEQTLAEEKQQCMLQLHLLRDTLCTDTRKHVRTLLEILPVSLLASKVTDGRGRARTEVPTSTLSPGVSICGLQLPNSLSIPGETPMQRLGTALGSVTLLVDMLATLLGAPLLHTLHYKGSTSELWPPKSFWDESAPAEAAIFSLHGAQIHPSAANGVAMGTVGALSTLKHHWPWEGTFKGTSSAQTSSSTVSLRQEREKLAAAVHQLSRSIGALLSDQLYLFPVRVPHEWLPFAALAGLCMQLAAEPLADGRRSLSASLAAPALFRGAESHAFLDGFLLDGEEEDEVTDGWDLVQRPAGLGASVMRPNHLLPPPPSEEDAIQHWERAMITDSTAHARVRSLLPSPMSIGQHIAPLGPAALATADRLWTGLWRAAHN